MATRILFKFLATVSVSVLVAGSAVAQDAASQTPGVPPAPDAAAAPAQSVAAPQSYPTLFPEPHTLTRAFDFAAKYMGGSGESVGGRHGWYVEVGHMPNGAGWLALGPGYRFWFLDDEAAVLDVSGAVSMRGFKAAQGRLEFPKLADGHLTIGTQVLWQDATQLNYFGIGSDSDEALQSAYRLKSTNAVAYAAVRPNDWLALRVETGLLSEPIVSSPTGPMDRGYPDAHVTFPDDPGFDGGEQPAYAHARASVIADTRDHRSHPSGGGMYRAAWSVYSDRDNGEYGFQQWEGEIVQFVPIVRESWTLAFHGWMVGTDAIANRTIPVYLMPSLGGSNTLRSYHSYRFHDNHFLLASAESRWALFTHVDLAAFIDAGNVAAHLGDLDLDKQSYGLGLRVHSHVSTLARLDVAHGDEGWQVLFRLNDPFRLNRLSRLTAAIPFVP